MQDRTLLREYTAARLATYKGGPVGAETADQLYDICAAGIAQEERSRGSTGANSRWWAAELLCWLAPAAPAGIPPVTRQEVR